MRWRAWDIGVCERVQGESGWRQPSSADARRVGETVEAVPEGLKTVLDAGCGNGWLCNRLDGRYDVVALDYVSEALRYVRVPKLRGDLRRLPFADRSFDLVLCSEVLEHLDGSMFHKVLHELVRVARKYVVVTVPNNEGLSMNFYRCPVCRARFSPAGHLRAFGKDTARKLFDKVAGGASQCTEAREIVPLRYRLRNQLLARLEPAKFGCWPEHSRAVCPRCGYLREGGRRRLALPLLRLALRLANRVLHPCKRTRARWLLATYCSAETSADVFGGVTCGRNPDFCRCKCCARFYGG